MSHVITVLGRNNSVNVQKVMWCAAELDLAIERKDIGGAFGGNDTDEYLGWNPNGKVPTLIDGDHVMWESNAIVRYLVDQYGSAPWYPETARERGLAGQWMDWALGELQGPMTVIFWTLIRTPPQDRNADALAAAVLQAGQLLALLDRHLATSEFVSGKAPGCGDIPVGGFVNRWFQLKIGRPELKNLERWYKALCQRPAFREHVMLPLT